MEKQLTITDLRAVYTKDYDAFGKMDPYLEFNVGKSQGKTQVANRGGKQPKWTAVIVLKFFDQTTIEVKSWEDDTTTRDFMGNGKIDIKSLKASGELQIKIIQQNGAQSGTVYGKYTLKSLAPVPMLIIRNIKCDFYKDTKLFLKTKPYFIVSTNGESIKSNHKQQGNIRHLQWNQTLRIKIKDGQRISLNVEDKNDNNSKIFGYGAYPKQFKTTSGSKRFYINDMSYQPLGTLQFQYQTINFVTKQESTKNQEAAKKSANELTQINISTIKGIFEKQIKNLYIKVCFGSNMTKTEELKKASKQFNLDVNKVLYGEKSQNKVIFAAHQVESIGGDRFHGSAQVLLDNLVQGQNRVILASKRNSKHGQLIINMKSKSVIHREVKLTDIKIKNVVTGDIVGNSQMYIIGQIGGWQCRTQTIQGKQVSYKQNLIFKFSDEKNMTLTIMDQDIDADDLMYKLDFNLEQFKQTGDMRVPLIPQSHKNDKSKHGELYFKYQTQNNIYKPKKQQIKKQQPKKQQPKKQEIKKQESVIKKPQPKKQQPKKQEPKKQQPKKQQQKASSLSKIQPEVTKKQQKLDPNAEKQLIIKQLRAVYLKDFDTFGKMDTFLQLTLGKQQQKTQTAHDSGKQPSYKQTFTFKYYDDNNLTVKAYDEDVSSNQYMGQGKVQTKSLKSNGQLQIKLLSEKGQHIGTIYAKYTLKALPLVPVLIIKNIQCNFYKETSLILKTKPYFSASTNGITVKTDHKQKGDSRKLTWNQTLKLKLKDEERVCFNVQDKADKNAKIFGYDSFPKQFKTLTGSKKFYVVDKNFQPLGTLCFDYETQNFVNKDQSNKNGDLAKKQATQLTHIYIQSIKGNLKKEVYDLYFKIGLGQNMIKTTPIDKAPKDFKLQLKQTLYAQKTQNKIIFAAYDEEMTKDTFKGSGQLLIQKLTNGENTVKLLDEQKTHIGDIIINAKYKNVPCREITISDIKADVKLSSDFIGDPQMYIVGKLGGSTRRTQSTSGKNVTFKQPLAFKYSQQKQLVLNVMDEDVTKDDQSYQVKVSLEQLKEKGQLTIPLIPQKYKDDKSKHGTLYFKYQHVNSQNKVQTKKQQPKKQVQAKKQQPKKQQPKKQQSKKEQPKKQQVKKEQPKKEQPKKEEPKNQQPPKKQITQPRNQQKKQQKLNTLKQSIIQKSEEDSIGKSKFDKSRSNVIKLPSINDPKNYGDKIFEKQSSSTLQRSILVYSMPKANRFNNGPKYTGQPTFYNDSSFKPNTSKGAGFGFGSKRQFPDWLQRNMKENPAPGSYFDHHSANTEYKSKGPTFGIPYKYYEKVMIPKQKPLMSSHIRKNNQ